MSFELYEYSLSVVISFDPSLQIGKLRLAAPGPLVLGTELGCSALHLVTAVFVYKLASHLHCLAHPYSPITLLDA